MAGVLSGVYLVLVLLTLFLEPFTPFENPVDWLIRSYAWLLPLQAAVVAAVAAVLFSRREA